jgi:hypothetical protein
MSDQLRDLLRQRALLQEHLSWLDREIAAASDKTPEMPVAAAVAPKPPGFPPVPLAPEPAAVIATTVVPGDKSADASPAAEALFEKYRVAPSAVQQDVRRGCFIYFAAAFALFAVGVVVLYFLISSR